MKPMYQHQILSNITNNHINNNSHHSSNRHRQFSGKSRLALAVISLLPALALAQENESYRDLIRKIDNTLAPTASSMTELPHFSPTFLLNLLSTDYIGHSNDDPGGAINNAGGSIQLNDVNFINNSTRLDGGAIYNDSGILRLTNAYFISNQADYYGGAIENSGGAVELTDANFVTNSSNEYGGAIDNNVGTIRVNRASFSDNSAGYSGGAIANSAGELNLKDTQFIGNSAQHDGGAIFHNGGTLNLTVSSGQTSLFSGNLAAGAANGIYIDSLNGDAVVKLTAEAGATLDMRDAMAGDASNGQFIEITKDGSGEWKLAGNNRFDSSDSSGRTEFNVNAGVLYLYSAGEQSNANSQNAAARVDAGNITLIGAGSDFSIAAGATLAAGGGNAITTDGAININRGATLAFDVTNANDNAGSPAANNAVLNVNASDGVNLTGTGEVAIDLLNLNASNGHYTLLYNSSSVGDLFNTSNINSTLTLRGQSIAGNARLSALALEINPNSLVLNQSVSNGLAVWNNASASGVWDIVDGNWAIGGSSDSQYIAGDAVLFDSTSGTNQNITVNAGGVSVAGMVVNSNGNYTFSGGEITADATSTTLVDPVLASGELVKTGSGRLTLNNVFNGNTRLTNGWLIVGGTSASAAAQINGDVQVASGAFLAGYGQILGGVSLNSGATLAPGNSIGALTVNNITFSSGSIYQVEANPDGSADRLNVTGTATINGGLVDVLAGAGYWNPTTQYIIVDSPNNPINGTFDAIQTNLAFLTATLDYSDPSQVRLILNRNQNSFENSGRTHNQRSTAAAIESLGAGSVLYNSVVSMSELQAQHAYDNLSGEIHASVKSAILTNSSHGRAAIYQHLSDLGRASDEVEEKLWVNSWYHRGHLKDDDNAGKLDNSGWALLIGFDTYSDGLSTVGVALGYERTETQLGSQRSSEADIDTLSASVYWRTDLRPVELKGGIGYGLLNADTQRRVSVGDLSSKNSARYDGHLIQIFAEGSHTFRFGGSWQIVPYGNLSHQRLKMDNFTEKGAITTLLQGRSNSTSQTIGSLGIRNQFRLNEKDRLYTDFGWRHSFDSLSPESRLNFLTGSGYTLKGVKVDRNSAFVGLGANFMLREDMSLSIGYEGEFGEQSQNNSANARWELRF